MKKITLLLASFFSYCAFAQITYTSADFATAGEQFTVSTANASLANFASTGANYNWNYSNLTAASQATTGWQNPNNSGYKLSWCLSHFYIFNCNSQFNSNFKLASPVMDDITIGTYTISNIVEHTNVNASGVANKMRGMTAEISGIPLPVTIDYDDPDELYNFPMVYGDSYTNTGHFELDMNNLGVDFLYSLSTTRTNTVQGWGSLTTPMGTFPNVLKIKCVTQRTDAVSVAGITIPIPTTTISYQWFSKEYGIPVLQADGFELFNLFIPTTVKYLDEQLCLNANAGFSYLPTADYNPDTQSASVTFNNTSTNYTSVLWNFGDGETSSEISPAHTFNCPGTKTVTLTVTNNVCTPTTTSTVTLPVTVTDSQNALTAEVTLQDGTLTAVRSLPGTTYQWIDCANGNAVIDGATSQTFTPSESGDYACMMSTNGCDATSACTSVLVCPQALAGFDFLETAEFDPLTLIGTVSFTNTSENYDSVSWDFGDGTLPSDEINPTHFYKCPGTFDVTLTVNSSICAPNSSVIVHQVVVTDPQNVMTTGVTVTETGLTAERDLNGTTYQWVDCDNENALIDGATSQDFMPTASGNYAVMLDTGGCTGISECKSFTLLGNGQFNPDTVQLYPNPTGGQLHLSGNLAVKSVEVYNMLGMVVGRSLDISSLASGMYLVKVDTDAGTLVRKVMKK